MDQLEIGWGIVKEIKRQRSRNLDIAYFQQQFLANLRFYALSHSNSMNPNRSFNVNPNRSSNGASTNENTNPNNSRNRQQSWNNQYQQYPEGYYNQGNNYQGYGPYNHNYNAFQGPYYEQPHNYSNNNQAYNQNNSFNHGNMDHSQSYSFSQYDGMNSSFQSMNSTHNLNSSLNSENQGLATTGRYGIGPNMKKKKKKGASQSSNSSVQPPKVKEPTIKEQSSQEFYFPIKTEVISYAVCPFNAGHLMEPSKLLKHINNCKMNSDNARHYKVCPYEPTHYFLSSQIDAHIVNCDMRKHFVVCQDWDGNFDLNNSTVSSFQSLENEVIPEEVKKSPILSAENLEKKKYEQFLIKP